jgi:hypothetical protein
MPTIEIDYDVHPRERPLRESAGGRQLEEMFEGASQAIATVFSEMESMKWPSSITRDDPGDPLRPYWFNAWFPPLDALSLAAVLKAFRPKTYLEVGSGNSTKFARKAVQEHNLSTKIISIDPSPRAEIDSICDEIIRRPLEDLDLKVFSRLCGGDVVFIDNSHHCFMNSDVTVFFTEVIPALQSGVVYGMHDIFLPDDYHLIWADRYYNEQYLLMMYLLGGASGDQLLFPASYVARHSTHRNRLKAFGSRIGLPELADLGTGCFWLKRS